LFRHSAATAVYLLTRDIKATQMQLRHSRIGTTSDVYAHPDRELLKETAELLAAGVTGSMASEKVQ
jgi:integrase